jgi:hypothetical protein
MRRTSEAGSKDPGPEPPGVPAPGLPAPSWTSRWRYQLRRWRFPISALVLGVGAALSLIAFAAWSPLINQYPFSAFVPGLKGADGPSGTGPDWTLPLVVVGPIMAVLGIYLVLSYLTARRRFEHLMRSKSKAEFLRNLPEVEDLIWELTPDDEERLLRKKQELRIRS